MARRRLRPSYLAMAFRLAVLSFLRPAHAPSANAVPARLWNARQRRVVTLSTHAVLPQILVARPLDGRITEQPAVNLRLKHYFECKPLRCRETFEDIVLIVARGLQFADAFQSICHFGRPFPQARRFASRGRSSPSPLRSQLPER